MSTRLQILLATTALLCLLTPATVQAQEPSDSAQAREGATTDLSQGPFRRRCPRCSQGYTRSERYCSLDGSKLESTGPRDTCPRCQLKAREGDLYCGKCGTDLATTEIRTDIQVQGKDATASVAAGGTATKSADPLAKHPWLGFEEKAWARYRVTRRTLSTSFAQIDGVHLETWTLGTRGADGYQLIMKGERGATRVAHHPIQGEWLKLALRLNSHRVLESSEPFEDLIAVHGRPLRCQVRSQVLLRLRERVEITIHYHPDVPGRVVTAIISRSMEGASSRSETRYELVEFDGSRP